MRVEIIDLQGHGQAAEIAARAAQATVALVGGQLDELSIVLLDDERMAELNARLLGRPEPTDVIAFEAEEDAEGKRAEIYVNTDAAERQGHEYGLGWAGELAFLVAHAVLHALGYADATEDQRRAMFALQEQVVSQLGVRHREP
jgi:probable rRNA maturation factor